MNSATKDNPFLAKAGHLLRSYARVAKKTGESTSNGICWLCSAGTDGVVFENFNLHPEWSHTMYDSLPWRELPPFFRALGCSDEDTTLPQCLFFDCWHNFHGGLGKHMVASTAVEVLQNMGQGNLQTRVQQLNDAYEAWREVSKLKLHCGRLDKELFGIESGTMACPTGTWSKFNDTRILMSFLEHFLSNNGQQYVATRITREALAGIRAANVCFRTCYSSGFWMTAAEAERAGAAGLHFLASYSRVAMWALEEGRIRYPMMPKAHYLHHSFRDMFLAGRSGSTWCQNALSSSVQMDEDFIGQIARLSRRVGSQLLMQRTVQRYLLALHLELYDEDSAPSSSRKPCVQMP